MRKRTFFVSIVALLGAGAVGLVWAAPSTAACALVNFSGLTPTEDGWLIRSNRSAHEAAHLSALMTSARKRIADSFGEPRAQPVIAFFGASGKIGPFRMNTYGSTAFVGPRACVFVGHNGENTDVIAHEFMHAELFERVGYWRRFVEVPTWFDEGVAMQVDHRSAYALPNESRVDAVRQLDTAGRFFVPDETHLTWNYAAAKLEVARWLNKVGAHGLYPRLERLRAGEKFEEVLAH